MQFVDQTQFGENGNCCSAALASYFDLSIDEVFDIYKCGDDWSEQLWKWFRSKNLVLFCFKPTGFESYEQFLMDYDHLDLKFDKYYFEIGLTKRGNINNHIVICERGKGMIHDPHPDKSGLITIAEEWHVLINPDELDVNFTFH